jgi:hypothetical protein
MLRLSEISEDLQEAIDTGDTVTLTLRTSSPLTGTVLEHAFDPERYVVRVFGTRYRVATIHPDDVLGVRWE